VQSATNIRKRQAKERAELQAGITNSQQEITKLQEARAPFAHEARKIEAEVGPIKFIAALIYGDNPDGVLLERAVRWVIILIVIVFDPLALTLLLAATKSLEWERGINIFNLNAKKKDEEEEERDRDPFEGWTEEDFARLEKDLVKEETDPPVADDIPVFDEKEDIPFEEPVAEKPKKSWGGFSMPFSSMYTKKEKPVEEVAEEIVADDGKDERPGDYVTKEEPVVTVLTPVIDEDPILALAKKTYESSHPDEDLDAHHEAHAAGEITTLPWHHDDHISSLPISDGERKRLMDSMKLQADNVPKALGTVTGFGTSFPPTANKGDLFLRVDALPTILYKFNGVQWIEVDKNLTDSYVYDDAYITHLIDKIGAGEYDPDLLSDAEREQIALKLKDSPSLG
jgi:hypothetical protein